MADNPFLAAFGPIAQADPALFQMIGLSLRVSLSTVAFTCLIGLPLGAALAQVRFRGRAEVVVTFNALMGLPPVVAGLAIHLLLSRSAPLGSLSLLFTPWATVLAQTVLILPLIVSLTRSMVEDLWAEYRVQLRSRGSMRLRAVPRLLWDGRVSLRTGVLAGYGRPSAKVGAMLNIGGNIAGHARTMTTAITLETNRGNLGLALSLGQILLAITFSLNGMAFAVAQWSRRRGGRRTCPAPRPSCRCGLMGSAIAPMARLFCPMGP